MNREKIVSRLIEMEGAITKFAESKERARDMEEFNQAEIDLQSAKARLFGFKDGLRMNMTPSDYNDITNEALRVYQRKYHRTRL